MYLQLKRIESNDKQTIGHLFVKDNNHNTIAIFSTLELPWRDNLQQKSCIPVGKYQLVKRWSVRYSNHFHVTDVIGRSMILIHNGNFFNHTLGCILIGFYHKNMNNDGYLDVVHSKSAMSSLNALITQTFTYLEISDVRDIVVI